MLILQARRQLWKQLFHPFPRIRWIVNTRLESHHMSVQEVLPMVPDHDGSSHIIMAQAPGIMMSARCQNNVDRKARSAKTRISTDTMDFSEHQGHVTQVRTDSAAAGNDLTLV
ncbi:hypothetical protein HPB50_024384 [Hyalomma asiaticum]|uniref:Uncharacterized protein n=1 Tax=Hyalomma asiaticum TaxID=266040 RepID=A0ACB7SBV0_HYAAI|nr:hypothetical protein HPB50_024384 [Hyalomma asiaticum]